MKILLLTYKFPPEIGGVSSSSYRIANSYRNKGYDVLILDLGFKGEGIKSTFYEGFKVVRFPFRKKYFTEAYEFLKYRLEENDFKFIHSIYFYPSSFLGFLLSKRMDIPHMASGRGNDVDRLLFSMDYFSPIYESLRSAEVVTAVTSEMKNFLEKLLKRNVVFIKNGFLPPVKGESIKRDGRKRIFRIGFSGEMREKKGMEVILKSLGILKDSGLKFKFIIVGDIRSGERDFFYLMLKKFNLKKNVEITGFLKGKEYVKKLLTIDVYIHPSLRDGMPNGIIEAFYYRIPVIGSKVGGVKDLLSDGRGILVDVGDYFSLSDAIVIFHNHRGNYSKMVNRAYDFVVKELTPEREIDGFLKEISKFL